MKLARYFRRAEVRRCFNSSSAVNSGKSRRPFGKARVYSETRAGRIDMTGIGV